MAKSRPLAAPSIFEFQDYKPYLNAWIASHPKSGRGLKSRVAETIRCQLAYISQVLKGSAHFSLEQAEALNALLGHSEEEGEYFLLLVERARAGTHELANFFDRRIKRILEQRSVLKHRLTDKVTLNREDQTTYYSHWAYCALHMAVLVPELRSQHALASYFGISPKMVGKVIAFLVSVGLVQQKGAELLPGATRIHLESDSPMITKHHINWRLQAMRSLEGEALEELHYSSVIGISRQDIPRVREVLVKAIEAARAIIKDSPDEEVCCYNLDFFGLGKAQR